MPHLRMLWLTIKMRFLTALILLTLLELVDASAFSPDGKFNKGAPAIEDALTMHRTVILNKENQNIKYGGCLEIAAHLGFRSVYNLRNYYRVIANDLTFRRFLLNIEADSRE